ncbi:integrase, catalytic region, zinc finger, CCHC-type containing protein [Tanacetum coccineum]
MCILLSIIKNFAKEIWDRVKLLMQGTKLSLQEKECKLYDEFDKFSFVKGETLYQYYWRFDQLINNMNCFNLRDYPIAYLNKAIAFLTVVASSSSLQPTIQLILSSIQRNQATIQDGRVTVQQFKEGPRQSYASTGYKGNATSSLGNNAGGQTRVVKCYNCQGEGHMARQCTQPKRHRNPVWLKKKAMLAEAQESGQILDEEQLAFLQFQNCRKRSKATPDNHSKQ